MSIQQSYLSSPKYGYSLAVATTQQSINSTMKAYLSTRSQPLVAICFVLGEDGNPEQVPYQDLLDRSGGADPFAIPADADPATDPRLQKLFEARFVAGFKARIGLPPKYAPADVPDIVTFNLDASTVDFRLMCAEFTIVSLTPGNRYLPDKWFSASQGSDQAWLFESTVDVQQIVVQPQDYHLLPQDVKNAIDRLRDGTFGVEQLLFDLDNAALQTVPHIAGVEPGTTLSTLLNQYFLDSYFTQLQRDGRPVLGCTITKVDPDPTTLNVTDVKMQVAPFVDELGGIVPNPNEEQRRLSTLNYLCMTDGRSPLPPVPFAWNWVQAADASDGVVALNRDVFARFLEAQIRYDVQRCCFKPYVRVWQEWDWGSMEWQVWYEWNLTGQQTPEYSYPSAGDTVLQMSYEASDSDRAGAGGSLGEMELKPQFDVKVDFVGDRIVVVRHLKIYCYVSFLASDDGGDIVDIKLTDTFTLGVGEDGRLTSSVTTTREDKSERPRENGFMNFFADVNSLIEDIERWADDLAELSLRDLPLEVVRSMVFPGGNTFVFKDVRFSGYQDLVARVTYADPSEHLQLTRLGRGKGALRQALAPRDLPAGTPRPLKL